MSPTVPLILLACVFTFSAAQMSCVGRCGAEYYRGYTCQCDYNCLHYEECCTDYESQCTIKNSCKGRCGETFKRGRVCSCDSACIKYKQCCPDYKTHCDAEGDSLIPLVSPTSYVPIDSSDDMSSQDLPTDEFSTNGPEGAGSVPESTSGYGSPTADQLDQGSFEPTLEPDNLDLTTETVTVFPLTETTPSDNEPTSASDEPSTLYMGSGESPTESTDISDHITSTNPGTTPAQPTTAAEHVSSPSPPTSASQPEVSSPATDGPSTVYTGSGEAPTESTDTTDPITSTNPETTPAQPTTAADHVSSPSPSTSASHPDVSPPASTPALETGVQATLDPTDNIFLEEQKTNANDATSDQPEVTTLPFNTLAVISTRPTEYVSQVISSTASSTLDLTSIGDANTSNPLPHDTKNISEDTTAVAPTAPTDPHDPSTSVSTLEPQKTSELDALTTHIPSPTAAALVDTTVHVTPEATTADPVKVTPDLTKPQSPLKPDPHTPSPSKPTVVKPTTKPESKPLEAAQTLNVDNPGDYQADDSNDTNLCSGRPVSAVTTLRNGTRVVFRGHYFWILKRNGEPGPAQGITQVWGVPSPIDTAFTRCNCQGKTYIFKGGLYWRFENGVLDRGYPQVIATGFDGLRGHITAALSVPQYNRRKESVFFFKRGGLVQRYSYQFGTNPTCGKKVQYAIYTVRNRKTRQAVSLLGPTINIQTSWRGYPTTITAAVSVPNSREPEGYKYYVFSRSKSYNVRMNGEHPVIGAPEANTSPQSNDFFKCPKQ